MSTCKTIPPTMEAVKEYIRPYYWFEEVTDDIQVVPYLDRPDTRINWDKTYIVLADGLPIAWTDGPLEE